MNLYVIVCVCACECSAFANKVTNVARINETEIKKKVKKMTKVVVDMKEVNNSDTYR